MSTTVPAAVTATTVTGAVKSEGLTLVIPKFYNKAPFWLILIAIILIIIVGVLVYTSLSTTSLSTTILVLYGLSLFLLILGILWAAWS